MSTPEKEPPLPPDLIARFRSDSIERIERLEALWLRLTMEHPPDIACCEEAHREMHTLKGDSRFVGFTDVDLLCHKLEELLNAAKRLSYRVPDDFDLVMSMGFRFLAMLVRKKAGSPLGGIDLPGFVGQIDAVLSDSLFSRAHSRRATSSRGSIANPRARAPDRVSLETRQQLAAAATAVFLEHLHIASSSAQERLLETWRALSDQVAGFGSVHLVPYLAHYRQAVSQLATELNKKVEVAFDVPDVRVSAEVAEALGAAVLHSLRNAVDHGIEAPQTRQAAGKRPEGRIWVRARVSDGTLEFEVEDDGAGIDFGAVQKKAQRIGLLSEAGTWGESDLIELLFQPGFSTRERIGDLSGRGVGLDVVRTSIAREGGRVALSTRPGLGTTVLIRAPRASLDLSVHWFLSSHAALRSQLRLAVSTDWSPYVADSGEGPLIDPLSALGIEGESAPQTLGRETSNVRVMSFRRGHGQVRIKCGAPPRMGIARRLCPTAETEACEVVLIDGAESLLFRPEAILALARPRARP